VADARADRNPSKLNRVTVNRARLTDDALGQESLAYGPVRAILVDAESTGTIEVAIGVWVLIGGAGRLGDDIVPSHILDIFRKQRFAEIEGSDEGLGFGKGDRF